MAEMSLEVQKQRILDMKSQLVLMNGLIEMLKYDLQSKLEFLRANGFPVEIEQNYKAHYLSSLYSKLDIISRRIMQEDTGYLNDVQVHIQEAINRQ
jgi:hypothetical protein